MTFLWNYFQLGVEMKNFFRFGIIALIAGTLAIPQASADLIISGVVDGTQTGGNPKGIELYATSAIADLAVFSVVRDTNGVGPFDSQFDLPSVALAAGDFFYLAGSSTSAGILNGFGFTVGATNSIANVNGDDILGIALASDTTPFPTLSDSFGLVAQGDTNFYENSFAIRQNTSTTGQSPGLTDATNFTITAYTDAGLQGSGGFGTFSPVAVPEPNAAMTFGLICLVGLARRRK